VGAVKVQNETTTKKSKIVLKLITKDGDRYI
jgi:hypothetical protein